MRCCFYFLYYYYHYCHCILGLIYDCQGVKKALPLAVVADIPETNTNLDVIYDKLHLEDCSIVTTGDFKCANTELGLSVSQNKYIDRLIDR